MKNQKIKLLLIILLLLIISLPIFSQNKKQKESYYRDFFADTIKGKTEVLLNDKSRVDIVTDSFAIEVDFAEKWAESIGQSLYYAEKLNKKPAILIIIDGYNDEKYLKRLVTVISKLNVKLWVIDYNNNDFKEVIIKCDYNY